MSLRRVMFQPLHRFVRWVTGRMLPPLAYPVITGPLRGARFVLRAAAGQGGGASVYVNRMEPAKTQALLGVLAPGQVVFDVGANIGYYTVLASRRVGPAGRVIAFEPFPRNIAYLYRHVAVNRLENVSIVPAACSDRSGLSRFVPGVDCAEGRLIADASPAANVEYVSTVTIDEIVRQSGFAPDVLKIDVEGAEERVLAGAAETLGSAQPILLLGVHSDALKKACTALLDAHGYAEPVVCEEVEGDTELLFMPARQQDGPARARPRPARPGTLCE
ncbi:MAG TPA: FkbM family methyltransferase [Vicinamibacterales bacterium]|nr:FkbM family methyltransferase [Vicinamibacterales bacterium]